MLLFKTVNSNEYFSLVDKYRTQYKDYRLYLLDTRAYIAKMELGIEINKYDLINDGNMGYNGNFRYVKEIDNYCSKYECLFIVNEEEVIQDVNQTNKYIVNYITQKYYKICGSNIVSVYIN